MESEGSYNSETIYEILEREIVSLGIKPGEALGENQLGERFSVSRTPVRAALRRLSDRGLVEILPYKGTRAALLSLQEIQQMIYMRVAVESAVLCDFLPLAEPIVMEKLRYIIRKQTVLLQGAFTSGQFYELDSQLHEVWFSRTGNMRLWEMIRQSQVHYTRFRMLDIVAQQQYRDIVSEHEALFLAIERKDEGQIRALIKTHLYGGLTRLTPRIHREFADYFTVEEKEK